jgi:TRAP transporter TAXI family solute receptor
MENLIAQGAENIDLVTPTQYLPTVIPALTPKLPVPVVYNCGGYESVETIRQLAEGTPVRLLSLTEKQSERLLETYGGYIRCTIPAGTYVGQTEDVHTVGVRAVLLASEKLSGERVQTVLSVLMDKAEEVKNAAGAETALSPETCGEGIAIPYHSGAAAFYKANGITVGQEVVG